MSTNLNTILKNDNLMSLTWEIDNFSTREDGVIKSEAITFPNINNYDDRDIPSLHLQMRVGKKLNTDTLAKYVSIHLVSEYSSDSYSIPAARRMAILNVRGEKCFTQEKVVQLGTERANVCNYTHDRATLLDPQNCLLMNDKLTIYCEIEIIDDDYFKCSASLTQDYGSLLASSKLSDVVLVVGGEELKAHANILSTRSKVFAAMFEHDCEEKRNSRVQITDVDKEVFQGLLLYIYTGKVLSLDLYAADLMVAADKYQLDPLKHICERHLSTHLTTESVCQILLLADLHQFVQLKEKCVEYITRNKKEINLADWKAICESNLELAHRLFQRG